MAKKELEIKTYQGENENSIVFVLNQNVKGFNSYQLAKAINNFINNETKVLEMAIETHLRQVLRENGILPIDGSKSSLERAFITLENNGKRINIYDRYAELHVETIVGESPNEMTCILEDDTLSAAMEVEVVENG